MATLPAPTDVLTEPFQQALNYGGGKNSGSSNSSGASGDGTTSEYGFGVGNTGQPAYWHYRAPVNTPTYQGGAPTIQGGAPTIKLPEVPNMPTLSNQDYGQNVSNVSDALYSQQTRYLQPVLDRRREQMMTRLANQGVPVGSQAYQDAMFDVNSAENMALADIVDRSVLAGGQEQSRLANLDLSRYGAQLQGGNMGFNQQFQLADMLARLRSQRAGELAASLGQRVPGQGSAIDPNQAYGMEQQGAWNQYSANQQNEQANRAAGAAILSSIIQAYSSYDFKENYTEIDPETLLEAVEQLPVEAWNYKGDGEVHIGTYAEEWAEKTGLGDGLTINLMDAVGVMMGAIKALSAKVRELENADYVE